MLTKLLERKRHVTKASLTHALHTALKEAWQRGYAKGEAEANAEQVHL